MDSRTAPEIDKIFFWEKKIRLSSRLWRVLKCNCIVTKKQFEDVVFISWNVDAKITQKKWGKINKRKNPRLHLTRQSLGFLSKNDNPYRNLVSAFFFGCNNSCKLDTPWRHSSMWQHVRIISVVEFCFIPRFFFDFFLQHLKQFFSADTRMHRKV